MVACQPRIFCNVSKLHKVPFKWRLLIFSKRYFFYKSNLSIPCRFEMENIYNNWVCFKLYWQSLLLYLNGLCMCLNYSEISGKMMSLQRAGRRESTLGKLTVWCLSFRTLCFMPLVWELTRGSCSSAWATMNCICGAGSPTPLRFNRWKPRPGRRSTRNNWKGEIEYGERGWGGREKRQQTAGVQQVAVPAGQQPVTWGSLRKGHEPCCVALELWLTGWTRDILQRDCKHYSSGLELWPCSLLSCLESWKLQGNAQVKA